MLPSLRFAGRRACPGPDSGTAVVAQSAMLATVMVRRHLPTCMTSGTFLPVGTSFSVNAPVWSVSATAT